MNQPGPVQMDCKNTDVSGSRVIEYAATEGLEHSFEYTVIKQWFSCKGYDNVSQHNIIMILQ